MKNKLFNFKNSIKNLDFDKNEIKKISTNFESIFRKIEKQKNIDNSIYNLIKKKILFSYKENKLRSFKSFNKIALIGMGGSILGSKAIYNFLKKKINKKVFFLIISI